MHNVQSYLTTIADNDSNLSVSVVVLPSRSVPEAEIQSEGSQGYRMPEQTEYLLDQLRLRSLMEVAPRESWEELFRAQGMKNPTPRMQILDGFNEGWIDFERGTSGSEKGVVFLETVLKALIERERNAS